MQRAMTDKYIFIQQCVSPLLVFLYMRSEFFLEFLLQSGCGEGSVIRLAR